MDTAGWIEQPHFSLANADHNGVVSWEFIKKKKKKEGGSFTGVSIPHKLSVLWGFCPLGTGFRNLNLNLYCRKASQVYKSGFYALKKKSTNLQRMLDFFPLQGNQKGVSLTQKGLKSL